MSRAPSAAVLTAVSTPAPADELALWAARGEALVARLPATPTVSRSAGIDPDPRVAEGVCRIQGWLDSPKGRAA